MTRILLLIVQLSVLLLVLPARADVILHAFNWKYSEVTARAQKIAALGYRAVLVVPPLRSTCDKWWGRYQPQDYRVIDNPSGNKIEFVEMIQALQKLNIKVYADIVLNHMANEANKRGQDDLNYPGHLVLDQYQRKHDIDCWKLFGDLTENLFSVTDFTCRYCLWEYTNVWCVQNHWLSTGGLDQGLPKLKPNDWVVRQQREYLRQLKQLGVQGFRIDAAKHMEIYHLNQVFTAEIKSGMHVFGDIITDGGIGSEDVRCFLNPYLEYTGHAAYDFPLFSLLRRALACDGSLEWLRNPLADGQALHHDRAITFTVTHDFPNNQHLRFLLMDAVDELLAYAYLLGRDIGTPLVYSDHDESGDNGRWVDAHSKGWMPGMVRFHNATRGETMQLIGATQCLLIFKLGKKGIVGINKGVEGSDYWVNTNLFELDWYVKYIDTLSGDEQCVNDHWHNFYLPGRTARMWLRAE
ncbi:alpha-amylase family glycosyl hydrolase [Endozoicomonadaceae bacterium StTr2]